MESIATNTNANNKLENKQVERQRKHIEEQRITVENTSAAIRNKCKGIQQIQEPIEELEEDNEQKRVKHFETNLTSETERTTIERNMKLREHCNTHVQPHRKTI